MTHQILLGSKNHEIVKAYLTKYYKLVHNFHIINKLKIYSYKTQLMITCKPKFKEHFKNFTFRANDDIIHCKSYIKILGITIRDTLDMKTQIGTICANLHHRIHNIKN